MGSAKFWTTFSQTYVHPERARQKTLRLRWRRHVGIWFSRKHKNPFKELPSGVDFANIHFGQIVCRLIFILELYRAEIPAKNSLILRERNWKSKLQKKKFKNHSKYT
jgi:hypothetical protein